MFYYVLMLPFSSGSESSTDQQSNQQGSETAPYIGRVLGTEDSTPTVFWFAVAQGASVGLDDLVTVETRKPDGSPVHFYGLVDNVRMRHEGVSFESDVEDVVAGVLPAVVSYTARVLVTRVNPEHFIPPQPGDTVYKAQGESLQMALSADKMKEWAFPAGLLADGQVAPINYKFVNGDSGGHINISGISGVATKTSYALFLLHSIFRSGVLGTKSQARALIFNVKGEDLLFLDKPNRKMLENETAAQTAKGFQQSRYELLGLPAEPFRDVQFLAPPSSASEDAAIVPNVKQRDTGISAFLYTIGEFCRQRMLSFAFVNRDTSLNLSFVVGTVEDQLHRLAKKQGAPYLRVDDWGDASDAKGSKGDQGGGEGQEGIRPIEPSEERTESGEIRSTKITTFTELVSYLEFKLLIEGDQKWVANQAQATLRAFIRRLQGMQKHLAPLIRGDVSTEAAQKHRPNPFRGEVQLSVVDIHSLSAHAQMFVVGVMLREVFEHKENMKSAETIFVVLDELNKYAPREGDSPIKDVLLDIAERGRSLGVILIGAQQTASEVERRIVSNAAVRVVGRLDLAEAERPEYRFLPQSFRGRAGILQPGTMLVSQPDIPNPLLVNTPFPAWATRQDEADDLGGKTVDEAVDDWLR